MKSIIKQTVIAAAALMVMAPAFAAENTGNAGKLTKGTKSYQTSRPAPQKADTQPAPSNEMPGDVTTIAPAAGDTMDMPKTGKSMKEELRLPRKN